MEKEVLVKIEGEKWQEALDKAFKKASKTAKIDGFRPGKAPKEVFLKKYGKQSLYMEAAEACLDQAYEEMVKESGDVKIVAQPDVTIKAVDDDHIEFKFVLTLKPTVKLGKYKELGIKKDEVKVSKEEVDHSLEHLKEQYTENVDKEGSVVLGDVAIIDFEGFNNGVAFEGGKGTSYSLKIGSHSFIPGFEEQVVGMKKGEEKDINVTFPDDYQEESLKGKPVVFKVKVNEIKEQKLPELNKDFFEDLGMEGITNEEQLRTQLEENLKVQKERDVENKYVDDLLEAARKNMTVEIPEVMIKEEVDRILKQYEENLKMQGLTLEMFYKFTNSDEAALRDQMKQEATNRVSYRLMLEAIAEAEKIEITEDEAKEETKNLASKYEMKEEDFLKAFGGSEMVKYDMQMRKAIEVLKK